eukprot:CAMPEP_0114345468 /NCGR_PEP_ID=MMETSP0101-20121206/12254_1 /TAXON_ID=38822 ORGANISM="Pteridomonas danica, Strain PT" /NCGR_SAMPLE_ID=MMETSP0101 /ASSEMBLY_ACC=CAM_ASM_000211 /LENGTH=143 /DNA_ID=CAMNT_0001481455 /DNA_START=128 /DNA_END=559 /DNA_ORIENTATION=+
MTTPQEMMKAVQTENRRTEAAASSLNIQRDIDRNSHENIIVFDEDMLQVDSNYGSSSSSSDNDAEDSSDGSSDGDWNAAILSTLSNNLNENTDHSHFNHHNSDVDIEIQQQSCDNIQSNGHIELKEYSNYMFVETQDEMFIEL